MLELIGGTCALPVLLLLTVVISQAFPTIVLSNPAIDFFMLCSLVVFTWNKELRLLPYNKMRELHAQYLFVLSFLVWFAAEWWKLLRPKTTHKKKEKERGSFVFYDGVRITMATWRLLVLVIRCS